jgi:hypothetical protein
MTNPNPSDALVRAFDASEFPDYVTTYGTELCLVPHLIRFSQALALESEQELINELGLHESNAHPEYASGFDDGLRHAARVLLKFYGADE